MLLPLSSALPPAFASKVILLKTSPNEMTYFSDAQYQWEQSCPYGYVIPEHPDNPRVQWVTNTPCAVSCK